MSIFIEILLLVMDFVGWMNYFYEFFYKISSLPLLQMLVLLFIDEFYFRNQF